MDIRVAGAGLPIVESLRQAGSSAAVALSGSAASSSGSVVPPQDAVAAAAALLSAGPVRELLKAIEAKRFSPEPAVLENLVRMATSAISQHDIPRAMTALAEHIGRDPDHASALLRAPALQPVQSELRELLHRVTQEAKTEAEHHLVAARVAPDPDLPDVIAVAERMMEAGQLAAYIRASELCRSVAARKAGGTGSIRAAKSYATLPGRLSRIWRRAPLLLLLAGWAAAGIALMLIFNRDTAAAIWSVGFLILVVLQFLITTRNY